MSMELGFAVVPFDRNGQLSDLHVEDSDEEMKDGVVLLDTQDEEKIPSPLGLSLNITGIINVNGETGGLFLELTEGDYNQRYVLLEPHRQTLEQLRAYVQKMGTKFRQKFLEVLLDNAEVVLKEHGKKAALLIY